jgi:hypothetical protein
MSTAILAKRCIHSYLRFQKRIYRSQCASCSIQSLLREASVQRWAVDNNRRHFNRGVDQRPCSSNRRYSSSKNNVRTNEINDTSKESRSSSNTVDIWFRLYVDDLPVATNAVKLQIPISNSADQADKTRPQHITMKDLQAAVKHARAADLAGFNTKWLEIYPSANASPTKPASASNQSTATAHTIGAYPLACEMAYNPLLHGGATSRAPLMVHAPKTARTSFGLGLFAMSPRLFC